MTSQQAGSLRVGLVGCGYVTTQCHLPALARIREAEVVALADVDERALESVGKRWGISRLYGSASELSSDPSVDIVAVCVPPALHAEVSLAALEAGKHVFIEKPLATSLAEADQIARSVGSSQQAAAVGFNLRCHALIDEARVLLRSGALGRVHAIRATFTDPPRKGGLVPAWRQSVGGALAEKAVHHFDLWRFLLDDEVDQVHAFVGADVENVVISARMRSGALANLVVSPSRVRNEIAILGDKGELEISLYRFDGLTFSSPGEIPGAPRARLRRAGASLTRLPSGLAAMRGGGYFMLSYSEQWRRFVQAIREGAPPPVGMQEGREALLIALAAAKAANEERAVSLDELHHSSSPHLERVEA